MLDETELIEFLKKNLSIKINWIDNYDACITLYLCGTEISQSQVDTSFNFADKYHGHND